jgi:ubiquinone/menaquinone biosynthesis C-methylase UbiE
VILDVGCGSFPRGDVNVDLRNRKFADSKRHFVLNAKKIKNFVLADGHFLPFKNNCFEKVVSHHVIEHVLNPYRFLEELIRVSKEEVEVVCPHRLREPKGARAKYHRNFFSTGWFKKTVALLSQKNGLKLIIKINIKYSYLKFPHNIMFPFSVPAVIKVVIRKC